METDRRIRSTKKARTDTDLKMGVRGHLYPVVPLLWRALADPREDVVWRPNLASCCQPLACPSERKICSRLCSGRLYGGLGDWAVVPWTCCRCALGGPICSDWDCRCCALCHFGLTCQRFGMVWDIWDLVGMDKLHFPYILLFALEFL